MNSFEAQLARLSLHYIGNKANSGELVLSEQEHIAFDSNLESLLWKYFVDNIKEDQLYKISSKNEPLLSSIQTVFSNPEKFQTEGIKQATRLYDLSDNLDVRDGDFFFAFFKNMMLEDEVVDAIGMFRCEVKEDYLRPIYDTNTPSILSEKGINVNKLDQGCIIFNTDVEDGYRVRVYQRIVSGSSKYWTDAFLELETVSNEYHHTNHYLKLTKDFVTKKLPDQETVSKTDQIDYLNRSMNYFKGKDRFDSDEFAQEIFSSPETQSAFNTFKSAYSQKKNIDLAPDFSISQNAVDKNKRVYRSVLKLDKNFHVYIHGDRSLIERGREPNGRKYYKIYYSEES